MNKKGFTFVEILIVVLVLSVLAAIAIPMFQSYRTKAYNSAALSDLKNVRTVLETYYAEHERYP